jgi:hypothetical protein
VLNQHLPKCRPPRIVDPVDHEVKRSLGHTDAPHAVVQSARTESTLHNLSEQRNKRREGRFSAWTAASARRTKTHLESSSPASDQVGHRNSDVVVAGSGERRSMSEVWRLSGRERRKTRTRPRSDLVEKRFRLSLLPPNYVDVEQKRTLRCVVVSHDRHWSHDRQPARVCGDEHDALALVRVDVPRVRNAHDEVERASGVARTRDPLSEDSLEVSS